MNILNDKNQIILGFEALLFSALFVVAFHSCVCFIAIFSGLLVLLTQKRGTIPVIVVLSFLWGFIAFSVGHSISWGWATVLGTAFFLLGVWAHMTGLKKSVVSKLVSLNQNNIEWLRNGYEGRQNLN